MILTKYFGEMLYFTAISLVSQNREGKKLYIQLIIQFVYETQKHLVISMVHRCNFRHLKTAEQKNYELAEAYFVPNIAKIGENNIESSVTIHIAYEMKAEQCR